MRTTFITILLCGYGLSAGAQVGYRPSAASTAAEAPKSNRYDSTDDFEYIPPDIDPASMVGQQLYFPGGWQSKDQNSEFNLYLVSPPEKAKEEEPKAKKKGLGSMIIESRYGSAPAPAPKKIEPKLYMPDIENNRPDRTSRHKLENKTFTITGFNITKNFSSYVFDYTLTDEAGQVISYKLGCAGKGYGFNKLREPYSSEMMPFYLVGYIQKTKNNWVGKTFYKKETKGVLVYNYITGENESIDPRKKYICSDYTFMDGGCVHACPKIVLKSEDGHELAIIEREKRPIDASANKDEYTGGSSPGDISYFYTEEEFSKIQAKEKEEADKAAAAAAVRRKEDSIQRKQDAAYRANVTKKYGAATANKILNGKVDLGMTPDMCKVAWGTPSSISKNTVGGIIVETWHYEWGTYLSFKNGKLTGFSE